MIDLFIMIERHLLKSSANSLCNGMENLLEVCSGIEISSSATDLFIRSILYDSNSVMTNFVEN